MSAPSQRGGNKVVVAGTTFHNMDPVLILNEPRIVSGTVHGINSACRPRTERTTAGKQTRSARAASSSYWSHVSIDLSRTPYLHAPHTSASNRGMNPVGRVEPQPRRGRGSVARSIAYRMSNGARTESRCSSRSSSSSSSSSVDTWRCAFLLQLCAEDSN